MTTNDASPSSSHLTRLLSLTYPLYERGDLSLSQLVPVHKSLCKAIASCDTTVDKGARDNEQQLAERTEQEQLLILQYRMGEKDSLQALATIVLPFLLTQHPVSENLREALLQAVLIQQDFLSGEWLQPCLNVLRTTHQWTTLCLVLHHLEKYYPSTQVTDFIRLKILEGVQLSFRENRLDVLHPIITWLMPLLDEKEELWTLLFTNYEENQSRALVITAVLCGILPSHTKLPTLSGQQRAHPIRHQPLWDLILYSLKQGMHSIKSMGDGQKCSSSQQPLEELLRRRGLHLLRLLVVEENEKLSLWRKYVTCFEALEMETESHLVDQVWDTVAEICVGCTVVSPQNEQWPPPMTWEWISAMLARVLLSDTPVLRKLGLYRFLSGHAGIAIDNSKIVAYELLHPKERHFEKQKAPLSLVSTDFVLNIIIPSYDTLGQSVGTNMQFQVNGKVQVHDITTLLESFLGAYMQVLDESGRFEFLRCLLGSSVLCGLRLKTTVMVFEVVANIDVDLPVDQDSLQTAVQSFGLLFNGNSVVVMYRERLLGAFALILSRSSASNAIDPTVLLKVLSLYSIATLTRVDHKSNKSELVDNPKYAALQKWLNNLGGSSSWASSVGVACASAFVTGQLFPPRGEWAPESGSTETERLMGSAIVLLCTLAAEDTPSSLLWPAIQEGLSTVPPHGWYNANRTCRSIILLESACRLGVVSGIELLVDQKQQMMPPNIECLLVNTVNFILRHMEALMSFENDEKRVGSARSGNTGRVSSMFALLISQLQVLCSGFPLSLALSSSVNKMLELSLKRLVKEQPSAIDTVRNTALAFGALSCGADPEGIVSVASCRLILNLEFSGKVNENVCNEQTARSVFQYAKWGTLSYILRSVLESTTRSKVSGSERNALMKEFFDVAEQSVYATPSDALLPLFHCVVMAARSLVAETETVGNVDPFAENLSRIISALFAVMTDSPSGRRAVYMLDEVCALLFRPNLLIDEFERLQRAGDEAQMPIRDAFRHLMEMAGKNRPHISRAVLCRISVTWLGNLSDQSAKMGAGLGAIPYRKDIAALLIHKEARIDEACVQQVPWETDKQVGAMELPAGINEMSVARGFVLMFISRLPDENEGLPRKTHTDLLHFVIFYLFDKVCLVPPQSGSMLMTGTLEYSMKIRAWQALCVLSRFVTADIATDVCDRVNAAMSQNLHGQIRYFLEAFAIQCARRHPSIFGRKLVTEIRRRDLCLQHASSLMIISGNLIVGRYKNDFFQQYKNEDQHVVRLEEILAGVIPWLSSTQGFSRAIAQLLVHNLIPLVIQIEDIDDFDDAGSDWFLRSIFLFLDENPEMKRLRKKQSKFFDCYDVDNVCSPESLLRLEVDDGAEANPEHMIDAIKKCLEQVYLEAHERDAPMWKQVADMLERDRSAASQEVVPGPDNELVNFQRKIIPLCSLEFDLEESRERRLRNALGRKKQQLVVCASLIDKVPNLAGLARTSEIFAATRLVIPDTTICRLDNFKSISVGAGEWIDIEGCKENNLLSWLRKQKERGYTIVGLEQTTSSIPLYELSFPERTVLLLGKEKEGIPVKFLQVVDLCVEIPQLGVIRSLNVHVSASLAIWEYTKQMMTRSIST